MAGRGVKRSRRRCDYGYGGRHARAHAVVCPCPPLFVRACACRRSSTLRLRVVAGMCTCTAHAIIFPVPVPALFVHACACCRSSTRVWWQACTRTHSLPVPVPNLVRLCLRTLPSLSVRSCSSPFVCWSPFVPGRLCPLGCVYPRYLVVLVWLSLVLVGVHLGLFVLVRPLFVLIWACLCLMGLGVRGRERIDGKKRVADRAIFGFVTV